ncbi:MAG TPA: hypothetical protein PKC38_00555 [Chitinophagales bacterium]|nr:hypothetical protein [Chitinophagales bacterium]
MKISDLQTKYNERIDQLQKQIINHTTKKDEAFRELSEVQQNCHVLATLAIDGDRELTGEEVLLLSNPANV